MQKWVFHVDMDAFFASVEQADNKDLQGKPVAVGGGDRGVICAASYEIRAYGVRSAMPMYQAKRLCPKGIYVPPRMARYKEVSAKIMQILTKYSPVVEPASIDEAYLDATGLEKIFGTVENLAQKIQNDIKEELGLTCSIGVAPVRFLAKIASDYNKPNGISIIYPSEVESFLKKLPIGKISGVGKKVQDIVKLYGVHYVSDILNFSCVFWEEKLGKIGKSIYEKANGYDSQEIISHRACKSVSAEKTFSKDIDNRKELERYLLQHAERIGEDLRVKKLSGRSITLKIKYKNFETVTRSCMLSKNICDTQTIYMTALGLLTKEKLLLAVRLLGISISHFDESIQQKTLFSEKEVEVAKSNVLDETIDTIRKKFGKSAVQRASILYPKQ